MNIFKFFKKNKPSAIAVIAVKPRYKWNRELGTFTENGECSLSSKGIEAGIYNYENMTVKGRYLFELLLNSYSICVSKNALIHKLNR